MREKHVNQESWRVRKFRNEGRLTERVFPARECYSIMPWVIKLKTPSGVKRGQRGVCNCSSLQTPQSTRNNPST